MIIEGTGPKAPQWGVTRGKNRHMELPQGMTSANQEYIDWFTVPFSLGYFRGRKQYFGRWSLLIFFKHFLPHLNMQCRFSPHFISLPWEVSPCPVSPHGEVSSQHMGPASHHTWKGHCSRRESRAAASSISAVHSEATSFIHCTEVDTVLNDEFVFPHRPFFMANRATRFFKH